MEVRDMQVLKVLLVIQETQGLKVIQETQELKVIQETQELKVPMGIQGILELKVRQD
jgi:hypothetical protein